LPSFSCSFSLQFEHISEEIQTASVLDIERVLEGGDALYGPNLRASCRRMVAAHPARSNLQS
jgi:hypothetical protein